MPARTLSLAEQIARISNPEPTDFDPEALEGPPSDQDESASGSDDESDDENAGREHYVPVGKSKLRKDEDLHLDPKYDGAKISRKSLYDTDESDDSEEHGSEVDDTEDESDDLEDESDATNRSDNAIAEKQQPSLKSHKQNMQINGHAKISQLSDSEDEDMDGDDHEDEDNVSDDDSDNDENMRSDDEEEDADEESFDEEDPEEAKKKEASRRAELRKIMADEQKNAVQSLSKAVQADATKGLAVREQRLLFDSLLNSRIKLQKAVISVNSLPQEHTIVLKAAEEAAIGLWNTISMLRQDLIISRNSTKNTSTSNKKRKFSHVSSDTSTADTWRMMQELESSSTPFRNSTLDKWSRKLQSTTTTALSMNKKLNQAAVTNHTITSQLREQLSNMDRIVSRTRIPRASAPIQAAAATSNVEEDANIYDDTDFYQQLLKSLVDQRMVDSSSGTGEVQWAPVDMADLKTKKKNVVDTRASKGRKLRYQVHEKLQNFMTPDDRLEWHEQQIDELFSSLLGQRLQVREEDTDDGEEEENDDITGDMPALKLFRSTMVSV